MVAARDWAVDLWFPFAFTLLGAVVTVATAWALLRHEIDKTQRQSSAQAKFAIDQFDYTAFWATGALKQSGHVPAGLAAVLRQYSAMLRDAFARDAERIHAVLRVDTAKIGSAEDPLKAMHLLFARIEAGVARNDIDSADLLAGLCASAYLRTLLDLDSAPQILGVLRATYADPRADSEVQHVVRLLVDNGPASLRAKILAV